MHREEIVMMSGRIPERTFVIAACAAALLVLAALFVHPSGHGLARAEEAAVEAGGVQPGDPNACAGDYVAQARVDSIIARLKEETVEESLANADYVDDYYYPGYYASTPQVTPWGDILILLSNRRFAKLYGGLKALPAEEQYALLAKYFEKFMSQQRQIFEKFDVVKGPFTPEDNDPLGRLSENPEKGPTLTGTVHAVRMITLLSGMLGQCKMWPQLKEAFKNPVYGMEVDEKRYSPLATQDMRYRPLFPAGVRANAVFGMAENSTDEEAEAVGFDRNAVLALAAEAGVRQIKHPDFRSRVTIFDVHHRMSGYDEDWSHGYFELKFISAAGRNEAEVLGAVAAAATAETAH